MALKYDFDLVPASNGNGGPLVAAFRDPRTAEALRGADEKVKALFRDAGFGFQPSGINLPPYHIDPEHLDLMDGIMERISVAHEKADFSGARWNGFDFWAFLDCALKSQPASRKMAAKARAGLKKSKGPSFGVQLLRFLVLFALAFVIVWELTADPEDSLLSGLKEALRLETAEP